MPIGGIHAGQGNENCVATAGLSPNAGIKRPIFVQSGLNKSDPDILAARDPFRQTEESSSTAALTAQTIGPNSGCRL